MKRVIALIVLCLAWVPLVYGLTINGAAPGAAASMTAVAVGSTTLRWLWPPVQPFSTETQSN